MVIHLYFRDVGSGRGHKVNDRIRQPTVIRSDGGNDDLHIAHLIKNGKNLRPLLPSNSVAL